MKIYTIGYGSRAITEFIDLLKHYQIDVLIDTRSVPQSRFRPDFRKNAFKAHLEAAGLRYVYLGDVLGGKKVEPDCLLPDGKIDLACVYAKESFLGGLARIEAEVQGGSVPALMCAEQRPENCHRAWMLAPPLLERGYEVLHIDERGGLKTQVEVLGFF
jgi:ATP-dependent DNA helicase RecQ